VNVDADIPDFNIGDDHDEDPMVSHDSAVIGWLSGKSNGSPVLEYQIQAAIVVSIPPEKQGVLNPARVIHREWRDVTRKGDILGPQAFRARGLLPGATYQFRVRQRNDIGWSKWSLPTAAITTQRSVPPGKPRQISLFPHHAVVRWVECSTEFEEDLETPVDGGDTGETGCAEAIDEKLRVSETEFGSGAAARAEMSQMNPSMTGGASIASQTSLKYSVFTVLEYELEIAQVGVEFEPIAYDDTVPGNTATKPKRNPWKGKVNWTKASIVKAASAGGDALGDASAAGAGSAKAISAEDAIFAHVPAPNISTQPTIATSSAHRVDAAEVSSVQAAPTGSTTMPGAKVVELAIDHLAPNTCYRVRARSRTMAGWSAWSEASDIFRTPQI
jgi:hypothetical protein